MCKQGHTGRWKCLTNHKGNRIVQLKKDYTYLGHLTLRGIEVVMFDISKPSGR